MVLPRSTASRRVVISCERSGSRATFEVKVSSESSAWSPLDGKRRMVSLPKSPGSFDPASHPEKPIDRKSVV